MKLVSLLTLTGNLSWLYTSDIKRLWLRVFLIFMIRTIAASIWYWRSWKTLSVVLACSSTWNQITWFKQKSQCSEQQGNTGTDTNRLFHLDLVYFDPEELVSEVVVAWKLVAVLHVFAFWDFGEHARFSAGERLQSASQLAVLCKRGQKRNVEISGRCATDTWRTSLKRRRCDHKHLFLSPAWSLPGWTPRLH